MPILKVICKEDMRDDIYELALSERIMFFVQFVLGVATLISRILSPLDSDFWFYITIAWSSLEVLFTIGGFIAFRILHRPTIVVFLILMALHSVMKVGYVVSMIYELRKANLRIALTTLSFILALVQLWAGLLLLGLLRDRNQHGGNPYMYIPDPFSKKRVQEDDSIWKS